MPLMTSHSPSEQLLAMSPEEILCRWVNYQLNKVGCKTVIKNLTHVSHVTRLCFTLFLGFMNLQCSDLARSIIIF